MVWVEKGVMITADDIIKDIDSPMEVKQINVTEWRKHNPQFKLRRNIIEHIKECKDYKKRKHWIRKYDRQIRFEERMKQKRESLSDIDSKYRLIEHLKRHVRK